MNSRPQTKITNLRLEVDNHKIKVPPSILPFMIIYLFLPVKSLTTLNGPYYTNIFNFKEFQL
jgi:hypothetical protein